MAEYLRKQPNLDSQGDELVDALLRLPVQNLENRITAIETEIEEREKMRNHILSKLETHKGQLQDHKERLKYLARSGQHQEVQHIVRDLLSIDISITEELRNCFKDISKLKERLQEAREELAIEKKKVDLIDSPENDNYRQKRRHSEKTKATNGQ